MFQEKLLEHMHDKGHANQLKEEFLRALMAGSLFHKPCENTPGHSQAKTSNSSSQGFS